MWEEGFRHKFACFSHNYFFVLMEASKLRRLLTCFIDLGCCFFIFLAMLRLLPARVIPVESYRFLLLGSTFLYYLVSELLFFRTIGKVIMGTSLVTTTNENPARGQLLLRTACRFLPLEPLSLLFSRQKISWHDRLSKTKVIYLGA